MLDFKSPIQGLLDVHSRYGLHTRASTSSWHAFRRLQLFRHLHSCSGCFRLERLPGGACTHWKAPPSHGAHPKRTHAPQQMVSLVRSPCRQVRVPFRRNQDSDRRCNLAAPLIARRLYRSAPLPRRHDHAATGAVTVAVGAVSNGRSGRIRNARPAPKGRSNRRMAGSSFRCDRSDSRRRRAR